MTPSDIQALMKISGYVARLVLGKSHENKNKNKRHNVSLHVMTIISKLYAFKAARSICSSCLHIFTIWSLLVPPVSFLFYSAPSSTKKYIWKIQQALKQPEIHDEIRGEQPSAPREVAQRHVLHEAQGGLSTRMPEQDNRQVVAP